MIIWQIENKRTKVKTSLSYWDDIKNSVNGESVLGPLLFNIFICDMFLMLDHNFLASYADDIIRADFRADFQISFKMVQR